MLHLGLPIAHSVASMASNYLHRDRIPLAALVKCRYLINPIKLLLHRQFQWFVCHLPGTVVSRGIFQPNIENCCSSPTTTTTNRQAVSKKQNSLAMQNFLHAT